MPWLGVRSVEREPDESMRPSASTRLITAAFVLFVGVSCSVAANSVWIGVVMAAMALTGAKLGLWYYRRFIEPGDRLFIARTLRKNQRRREEDGAPDDR
jgi:hypothetical protein